MFANNLYQLCRQYGFTHEVILAKLNGIDAPRVVLNSIPKAGTNLLIRTLYLLYPMHRMLTQTVNTGDIYKINSKVKKIKKGQFMAAHIKYSKEIEKCFVDNSVKNILIVRDPRDIAVSNYVYITYKDSSHRLHKYFKALNSDSERLMASIQGVEGKDLSDKIASLPLAEHINSFLLWVDRPDCLVVRFEDLVGNRGGGSDLDQVNTVKRIVKYLRLSISDKVIKEQAVKIFNPESRTFVNGKIGAWKNVLEEKHKVVIAKEMNDVLIKLGYEKNTVW